MMEALSYLKLRIEMEENSTKEFKFVRGLSIVFQYTLVFHPVEWIVEQVHRQTDTSMRKSKLFANYLTVLILSSPLVFAQSLTFVDFQGIIATGLTLWALAYLLNG